MFYAKGKKSGRGVSIEKPLGGTPKLGLTDNMKSVLLTDHGFTELQW